MDIVERLRICAKYDPDQAEAADEIERLRGIINDDRLEGAADEIERLRLALQHILTHCKSDTPPNAQAIILFVNNALEEKE